jgi:hypothetical protein
VTHHQGPGYDPRRQRPQSGSFVGAYPTVPDRPDGQWHADHQRAGARQRPGDHRWHGEPQWRGEQPRQGPGVGRPKRRRADASRWHWLLLVAVIVPLATPLYNRIEPRLFGLPFYYWGQLAFALLSTLVITIVHIATKGRQRG